MCRISTLGHLRLAWSDNIVTLMLSCPPQDSPANPQIHALCSRWLGLKPGALWVKDLQYHDLSHLPKFLVKLEVFSDGKRWEREKYLNPKSQYHIILIITLLWGATKTMVRKLFSSFSIQWKALSFWPSCRGYLPISFHKTFPFFSNLKNALMQIL